MKTNRPTSVLVFLGSCLFFAEALVGVASAVDKQLSGIWVLAFGTINLVFVVGALLFMFWYKPEFLAAERGDVVLLRAIEAVISHKDPKLVRELIQNIDWKRVTDVQALPDVEKEEASSAAGERQEIEKVRQAIVGGKKKAGGA